MSKTRKRRIATMLLMLAPLTATTFAPGCLETALLAANPCGTILNCDPDFWQFTVYPALTVPNWELDPSCVIPGACGDWPPPEFEYEGPADQ